MNYKLMLPIFAVAVAMVATSCHSRRSALSVNDGDELYSRAGAYGKNEATVEMSSRGGGMTETRRKLVLEARRWIGVPYRYGGETRTGVDCSGLVMVLYRDVAGVKLPRVSSQQYQWCKPVETADLQPGDLVFFNNKGGLGVNHVGIYVGSGCFVHASSSRGVIESELAQDYYRRTLIGAGRAL